MKKEITANQLEKILFKFCEDNNLAYRGIIYEKKYKWIVFHYGVNYIDKTYGMSFEKIRYEGYSMEIDENNRFITVKRGLTKQLKGFKIIDIENIKIK